MLLLTQEWLLLRANRAWWVTLFMLGLLTALAFQIGWSRAEQTAGRDQRYSMEQAELHLLVEESVQEQSTKQEPLEMRRTMMGDPQIDLEQLFKRSLTDIEKGRFRVLWNFAKGRFSIPHLPWRTWKRSSPLEALSVGVSDHWPSFYAIDRTRQGKTLSPPSLSNPFQSMIGVWDISTLLTAVLPLFMIVVFHDLVSGDREQGTIRLILSQSVDYRRLVLIRLLLRATGIVLVILLVVGVGMILSGVSLSGERTRQLLGVFSLSVILYVLFWSSIAWLINAMGTTSVTNAVLMTMCWVLLVIVLPLGVSQQVAKRHSVTPLSSLAARERTVREEQRRLQTQQRATSEHTQQSDERSRSGIRREEARITAILNELRPQREAMGNEIAAVLQKHQSRSDAMDATIVWSPALAIKNTCDLVSGNSLPHYIDFARRTSEFHRMSLVHFQEMPHRRTTLSMDDIQAMPVFQPTTGDERISLQGSRSNLVILAIWTAIPFLLGWIGFRSRP